MKRTVLVWAVVLMAVIGAAPTMLAWQTGGDPHEETQSPSADIRSNRAEFGAICGVQDTSDESAAGFVMSGDGEWSALPAGGSPSGIDQATARVWHETNWMVDMHAALEPGMAGMHSGQLCFDPQGRITFMVDRYMRTAQCGCARVTSLTFAPDGRVTRRDNRFVSMSTGEVIAAPEAASGFPDVWDMRKLEQLPFSPLLKR
ncbi:MAG: hypothetical protein WA532_10410 [Candidatus Korobacteraceae bacterium]